MDFSWEDFNVEWSLALVKLVMCTMAAGVAALCPVGLPHHVIVVGFGQHLVATCRGADVLVFWQGVLDRSTLKPGPDKNHNDLSVTCGGSLVA